MITITGVLENSLLKSFISFNSAESKDTALYKKQQVLELINEALSSISEKRINLKLKSELNFSCRYKKVASKSP
ncbi:MAG: hypothetical protein ACD_79C01035G0001 [uncultured bacterium]|nr:MAG: hypothetical protein ACD_79C01035G0001 [uncultured bacterium]